jgi:hypothetical protein
MLKLKKLIEEQKKELENQKSTPIIVEKPIEKCDLITRLRERQECEDC